MSKRYILLDKSPNNNGIYTQMPFHASGHSQPPLPISIQAETEEQATTLHLALQRWIDKNPFHTSTQFIGEFLSSSTLQTTLNFVGPSADNTYWWVSYGDRSGLYMSSREAIGTVDLPRNASDWRRGYAFKTFIEAFRASLTGDTSNRLHDYNPTVYPTVAAEIRRKLLSTASVTQANLEDSNVSVADDILVPSTPPTHEGSSAPGPSPHDVPQSSQDAGSSNLAASNVPVDNISVPSTPTHEGFSALGSSPYVKGKAVDSSSRQPFELGVTWGRALLRAMNWDTESIDSLEASISQAGMNSAQFSVDILEEFPEIMNPKLACFVWALYHGQLNEPYAYEL
ncbi:hypothetical protein C8R42DRAFT_649354 [Lentinula raphanica]|nr:hypothetical protein C8R42DRAFT_649354 [Lentinula raphanica]